jgi:hypothetical protein
VRKYAVKLTTEFLQDLLDEIGLVEKFLQNPSPSPDDDH